MCVRACFCQESDKSVVLGGRGAYVKTLAKDNTLTDVSMTIEPLSYSSISSCTFVGHSNKFAAEPRKASLSTTAKL